MLKVTHKNTITMSEAYLEPCQTSMIKIFVKTVNVLSPLTIFAKNSIVEQIEIL